MVRSWTINLIEMSDHVTIQLRTKFAVANCKGQRLGILGSHEALGCWDESRPLLAKNVWQDFWEVCFSVPSGTRIEWKWIIFEVTVKQITQKESTPTRNLVAPNSDSYLSVPWEEAEGFMMPLFKYTQYRAQGERNNKDTQISSFTTHVLQEGIKMSTIPAEINCKPHGKGANAVHSSSKRITERHQAERHDKVFVSISSKSTKRKISKAVSAAIPRKVCKYVHEATSLENGFVPTRIYDKVGKKINGKMEDDFEKDIKPVIFLDKDIGNTNLNAETSFKHDKIPSNFHYKIFRNIHPVNQVSYEKDIMPEKVNQCNTDKELAEDVDNSTDVIRTRVPQSRTSVLLAVPTIIFGTGVLVYIAYKKLR
ncbi:hypothetical protein CHS0354_031136 [Potamilus streckersoni]|uniref:CBM20 domain-containing protein n=1 Tax=Potamilus streckersoni TaxID=2493646 RepID=A0AAE0TBS9_9BIVA|nr:hypothetical protein CHS0354_031136 [Potamilus streckersoni]